MYLSFLQGTDMVGSWVGEFGSNLGCVCHGRTKLRSLKFGILWALIRAEYGLSRLGQVESTGGGVSAPLPDEDTRMLKRIHNI